jgi:phage terminase large subunit-like protein
MDYGEWARLRDKDPTLRGAGYKASIVVGSHPTGVFIIDDINNDKNTESERMNNEVNRILTDTLFPMIENETWPIFVQTPWTKRDALAVARNTGVWHVIETPVYKPAPKRAKGAKKIVVKSNDGNVLHDAWAYLTWPEKFDPKEIGLKYRESGAMGFARMYLLDLSATEGVILKREWLKEYPHEEIGDSWVEVWGIDHASTADKSKRGRDYFALARWKLIPGGGMVLIGGVRRHVSEGEAVELIKSMAQTTPMLRSTGVEVYGKGDSLYQALLFGSNLKYVKPITYRRNMSKGVRFEKEMAPHFEIGRAFISDKKDDFLKTFIEEWVSWPNGEHDDCLDAAYIGMLSAPGNLIVPSYEELPNPRHRYHKPVNPFIGLGG